MNQSYHQQTDPPKYNTIIHIFKLTNTIVMSPQFILFFQLYKHINMFFFGYQKVFNFSSEKNVLILFFFFFLASPTGTDHTSQVIVVRSTSTVIYLELSLPYFSFCIRISYVLVSMILYVQGSKLFFYYKKTLLSICFHQLYLLCLCFNQS